MKKKLWYKRGIHSTDPASFIRCEINDQVDNQEYKLIIGQTNLRQIEPETINAVFENRSDVLDAQKNM